MLPTVLKKYENVLKLSKKDTKFCKDQTIYTFDGYNANRPKLNQNNKSKPRRPLIENNFDDFEESSKDKPPGFYYKIKKNGTKYFIMKNKKGENKSRCIHLRDKCIICSPIVYDCTCGYFEPTAKDFDIMTHIDAHQNLKSYHCDLCKFRTNIRQNIYNHKRNKHFKNSLYSCTWCGYASIYKSDFSVHYNEHLHILPKKCITCYTRVTKPKYGDKCRKCVEHVTCRDAILNFVEKKFKNIVKKNKHLKIKCDYSVTKQRFLFNMVFDFGCSCEVKHKFPINNPKCKTAKYIVLHTEKKDFTFLKGFKNTDFYKPCIFFNINVYNLKLVLPIIEKELLHKGNQNCTKVIL